MVDADDTLADVLNPETPKGVKVILVPIPDAAVVFAVPVEF
jgi:hypothetical protein